MKKILGIAVVMGVALLAGCSENDTTRDDNLKVLNTCEEMLWGMSDTKLASSVSIENFEEMENFKTNNYYNVAKESVHHLKLLYSNNNFKISNNAVRIECNYVKNGKILQKNEMAILNKMNKETGIVSYEFYGTSEDIRYEDCSTEYYFLELNYDFKENKLNCLDLYCCDVTDGEICKSYLAVNRFTSGKMYYDKFESKDLFCNYMNDNYWSKHKDNLVNAEKIGDFSKEYTDSINYVFGEDAFDYVLQ